MIRSILFTVAFLIGAQAQAITCKGSKEVSKDDGLQITPAELSVELDNEKTTMLAVDIEDSSYYVLYQKDTKKLLMAVSTNPPNWNMGATNGLKWDGESQVRVTRVDGNIVYKLICDK